MISFSFCSSYLNHCYSVLFILFISLLFCSVQVHRFHSLIKCHPYFVHSCQYFVHHHFVRYHIHHHHFVCYHIHFNWFCRHPYFGHHCQIFVYYPHHLQFYPRFSHFFLFWSLFLFNFFIFFLPSSKAFILFSFWSFFLFAFFFFHFTFSRFSIHQFQHQFHLAWHLF